MDGDDLGGRVRGLLGEGVDVVRENPLRSALGVAATVALGGLGLKYALRRRDETIDGESDQVTEEIPLGIGAVELGYAGRIDPAYE